MSNATARIVARPTAAIARLKAYDPGHDLVALRARATPQALAELGSNESPLGPPAAVFEALAAISPETLWRYPDPRGGLLKRALADQHGVDPAQIVLGNGSHELLMLLGQGFAGPGDEVLCSEFSFAVFALSALAVGATPVYAPANPRSDAMPRGHALDALANAVSERTRLIFLANPNNPTGTWLGRDELARFVRQVPAQVPIVIDEAYVEYLDAPGADSALGLCAEHPNLIVTRTFSKAFGLAGLRVGWLLADPGVVAVIERLRESFNVGALGLVLATAALSQPEHLARVRAHAIAARAALSAALVALGVFVHPSQTNFLLVDFERDAAPIERALIARGVVTRPMVGYGLPSCLRINFGMPADHARLLDALTGALQ